MWELIPWLDFVYVYGECGNLNNKYKFYLSGNEKLDFQNEEPIQDLEEDSDEFNALEITENRNIDNAEELKNINKSYR